MTQTLRFIWLYPKLMLTQTDINNPQPLNVYHFYKSYIVGFANNYDVITIYIDVVFWNNHHVLLFSVKNHKKT